MYIYIYICRYTHTGYTMLYYTISMYVVEMIVRSPYE